MKKFPIYQENFELPRLSVPCVPPNYATRPQLNEIDYQDYFLTNFAFYQIGASFSRKHHIKHTGVCIKISGGWLSFHRVSNSPQ